MGVGGDSREERPKARTLFFSPSVFTSSPGKVPKNLESLAPPFPQASLLIHSKTSFRNREGKIMYVMSGCMNGWEEEGFRSMWAEVGAPGMSAPYPFHFYLRRSRQVLER